MDSLNNTQDLKYEGKSQDYIIIASSKYFDKEYYLENYPEVKNDNLDPVEHYLTIGFKEGKNPSKIFNTNEYYLLNSDAKSAGINPLLHYEKIGKNCGRLFSKNEDYLLLENSEYFNKDWYYCVYHDIKKAGADAIAHYLYAGAKEGRNPSPIFSTEFYLKEYPDVKACGINPLVHFLRYGQKEGRYPRANFKEFLELINFKQNATPQKKNVLLISHEMTTTGAPLSLKGMARVLKSFGFGIEIWTLPHILDNKVFDDLECNVIKVPQNPEEFKNLEKALKNFDLVICNTIVTSGYAYVCHKYNVNYLLVIREALLIPEYVHSIYNSEKLFNLNTNRIVVVSDYAKNIIESNFKVKVRVLHNYIDDISNISSHQELNFDTNLNFSLGVNSKSNLDSNLNQNSKDYNYGNNFENLGNVTFKENIQDSSLNLLESSNLPKDINNYDLSSILKDYFATKNQQEKLEQSKVTLPQIFSANVLDKFYESIANNDDALIDETIQEKESFDENMGNSLAGISIKDSEAKNININIDGNCNSNSNCDNFGNRNRDLDLNYLNNNQILKKKEDCKVFRFITCGTIEKRKGIDVLLNAFLRLNKSLLPKWELYIAGFLIETDKYFNFYKEVTKDYPNIHWCGIVKGDKKWELFRSCDVFLVPSLDESCSRVVLEAAMLKKPTVISKNVGATYILENNAGFICETGNVKALKETLEDIIANKFDLSSMGERAHQNYLNTSTKEIYVKNFKALIDNVLNEQNASIFTNDEDNNSNDRDDCGVVNTQSDLFLNHTEKDCNDLYKEETTNNSSILTLTTETTTNDEVLKVTQTATQTVTSQITSNKSFGINNQNDALSPNDSTISNDVKIVASDLNLGSTQEVTKNISSIEVQETKDLTISNSLSNKIDDLENDLPKIIVEDDKSNNKEEVSLKTQLVLPSKITYSNDYIFEYLSTYKMDFSDIGDEEEVKRIRDENEISYDALNGNAQNKSFSNDDYKTSLVILVSNGLIKLKNLMGSLEKIANKFTKIILVDDASNDADLVNYLNSFINDSSSLSINDDESEIFNLNLEGLEDKFIEYFSQNDNKQETNSKFIVIRNKVNLGSIKSANLGLSLGKMFSDIVVLLNSNSLIPESFYEKITKPFIDKNVALVTSLSDKAGCYSFPTPDGNFNKTWFDMLISNQVDINQISLDDIYLEVPVANGFCMANSKVALENVGLFDEKLFKDFDSAVNEWCLRACDYGFKHMLATNLLVCHQNDDADLNDEVISLKEQEEKKINLIYPNFEEKVGEFFNSKVLKVWYNENLKNLVQYLESNHRDLSLKLDKSMRILNLDLRNFYK